MSKDNEEIKQKLAELEASLVEDSQQQIVVPEKTTQPAAPSNDTLKSDLYMVGGLGLLLTGLLLFLHHVHVTTGYMTWLGFGSQGFGFILIPLMIGIGFLFYDHNNKIGWVVTAASLGLVFFSILSHLVMVFPSMSLLGVILMLLPLAAGGAFVMKAIKAGKEAKK